MKSIFIPLFFFLFPYCLHAQLFYNNTIEINAELYDMSERKGLRIDKYFIQTDEETTLLMLDYDEETGYRKKESYLIEYHMYAPEVVKEKYEKLFNEHGQEILYYFYRFSLHNNWVNSNKIEWHYNSDKNKTTEIYYKWSNNAWREDKGIKYDYNSKGLLTSLAKFYVLKDSTKSYSEITLYEYDEDDKLLSEVVYNIGLNDAPEEKITWEYAQDKNQITETFYKWNEDKWKFVQKTETIYDENDNILTETESRLKYFYEEEQRQLKIVTSKTEYAYTPNGDKKHEFNYLFDDNKKEWEYTDKREFEYNDANKLLSVKNYEYDGKLFSSIEYEYFDNEDMKVYFTYYADPEEDNGLKDRKRMYSFSHNTQDNYFSCILFKWENDQWKTSKTEIHYYSSNNIQQK